MVLLRVETMGLCHDWGTSRQSKDDAKVTAAEGGEPEKLLSKLF